MTEQILEGAGTVLQATPDAPTTELVFRTAGEVYQLSLPELAEAINSEVEAAESLFGEWLAHAIRAGEMLIDAKARVRHGEWLPWLEANFCRDERTARRYMQLAEAKDLLSNRTRVSDLSMRAALEVLSGDEAAEREARRKARHEAGREGMALFPAGHFGVIYADPPWSYDNSGLEQSAESQYPTEAIDELCDFTDAEGRSVADVVHEASVLFLWATSPLLPEAIRVMAAWGFDYKTSLVWRKDRAPGIGWWARTFHELLLVGVRAETPQPAFKPDSVIDASVGRHSSKPAIFADLVQAMYPGPKDGSFYLEMFAREARPGWAIFGNEAPS